MANPYDEFRITPPTPPALPDNPYAQYGTVRQAPAKPAPRSAWDMLDNIIRQAAAGGSLSSADEIAAAGDSALTAPIFATTGKGPTPGEMYDASLKANREKDKAFVSEYPITSSVANAAGVLSLLVGSRGAGAPAIISGGGGRTLPGVMARGAVSGAGLGGITGFNQGEGSFEDRAKAAGYGAAIGGGAGALLPPIIATGGAIAKPLGGRWLQENVGAPMLDKLADVTAYMTPKARPGSLSAAAPDGGPGIPMAGMMDNITDALRGKAATMAGGVDSEAMKAIAKSIAAGGRPIDDIARELTLMGPEATLANASPIQTQNLLRTAYMSPGSAMQAIKDALDAQQGATPRMMTRAFEGPTSPPNVYDATRYLKGPPEGAPGPRFPGYIATEGQAIYDPLRSPIRQMQISPAMQEMIDNNPAVRAAFDNVKANASDYGQRLSPFDLLHRVKRQLNLDAEAAIANGRAVNKADVAALADRWERELYAANRPIQRADQAYAELVSLPDWLDRGRTFMRGGINEVADLNSPAALAAEFPRATAAQQQLFRVGATGTVSDAALSGDAATRRLATNINTSDPLREKIGTIFPDRAPDIVNTSRTISDFADMKNRVMRNSQTAAVLADQAEQGIPSLLKPGGSLTSRAWDAVMDQGRKLANNNEAVRDAYTRVLLETNPTQNLKNLEILDALIKAQLEGSVARSGAAAISGGQGGDMLRVRK